MWTSTISSRSLPSTDLGPSPLDLLSDDVMRKSALNESEAEDDQLSGFPLSSSIPLLISSVHNAASGFQTCSLSLASITNASSVCWKKQHNRKHLRRNASRLWRSRTPTRCSTDLLPSSDWTEMLHPRAATPLLFLKIAQLRQEKLQLFLLLFKLASARHHDATSTKTRLQWMTRSRSTKQERGWQRFNRRKSSCNRQTSNTMRKPPTWARCVQEASNYLFYVRCLYYH